MISFRSRDYMYSYNKMPPKPFSTHLHRYYEFLYFVQGDATYVVEGKEYSAENGDLFITCPGELHSIVFKSDTDYERHFIQISEEFLGDLGVDMLSELRRKPFGENNKISHTIVDKNELERCFFAVRDYVTLRCEESDVMIKTYIIQLLAMINKLLPGTEGGRVKENDRVSAAKAYINSNLCGELSLEKISDAAFTDKYYLSHLFRRETGMSVTDYVNMQKIALAKKLIARGGSASKIYRECGFRDYSSFYRAFKRLSGKSPTEFFEKIVEKI